MSVSANDLISEDKLDINKAVINLVGLPSGFCQKSFLGAYEFSVRYILFQFPSVCDTNPDGTLYPEHRQKGC